MILCAYKPSVGVFSTYKKAASHSLIKAINRSATAMSEAIVLPSLSQWTKNHLTAIIQATTPSAFDAFLFKDAVITVKGRTHLPLRIHYPVTKREIRRNEGFYLLRSGLPPPPHNIRGFTDRRKVKVLNEVVLEGPVPSKSG